MIVFFFATTGGGGVDVRIHDGVTEPTNREADLFGDDLRKRSVTSEVERNTERDVTAALRKMTIEPTILNIENVAVMARRQFAGGRVTRFPCGNNHPAAGWFSAQRVEDELNLVNFPDLPVTDFVPVRMRETPPVPTVGGIEITGFVSPRVPNFGVLPEITNVVFTGEIPEQFMEQRVPDDFFGGEQRKSIRQIHPVMRAEIGNGVDTGAALFERTIG